MALGIDPAASHMLGKCSITEQYPQLSLSAFLRVPQGHGKTKHDTTEVPNEVSAI